MSKEVHSSPEPQHHFRLWDLVRLLPVLALPFLASCGKGGLPNRIFAVTYSPDDFNQRSLVAYDDNPATNEQINFLTIYEGDIPGIFDVSPDGSSILMIKWDGNNWDVYKLNTSADKNNNELLNLTNDTFDTSSTDWSPDGSQIVYSVYDPYAETSDIYVMDAEGQNQRPLVRDARLESSPLWSPDGTKIAYLAYDNNATDLFFDLNIFDIPSGNVTTAVTFRGFQEYSWSPYGDKIAYSGFDDSQDEGDIYVYDVKNKESVDITPLPGIQWAIDWSLDGNQIVFNSDHLDGTADICLVRPDGNNLHCITESNTDLLQPQFSLDGRYIYFTYSPFVYEDQFLYRVPVSGGDMESVSTPMLPRRIYTYKIGQFQIGEEDQSLLSPYPRLVK